MKDYFKRIWLGIYTVLVGMNITLKHLFSKKVTNQYPDRWHPIQDKFSGKRSFYKGDEKHGDIPPNSRNRIFLDIDLCNGCMGCVRACPVNCITVETLKVVPGDNVPPLKDGSKRGLWVTKYEIDFAKCCFCSLCVDPCPTNAIRMTPEFEYSAYNRKDLVYKFSVMTEEEIKEKKELLAKFQAEKKKASAEKTAKETKKQDSETEQKEDNEH